jgi:hypothetical protein
MTKLTLDDPMVELLMKPENIGPVCEIYNNFPRALAWAGKVQLMKAVHDKCREQLKAESSWRVELDPKGDDRKLLEEEWPSIYIAPNGDREWRCWYFSLSMNASDLPFKLEHGVISPDKSVLPTMSPTLSAEAKKIEDQFKIHKFRTGPTTGGWLGKTDRPYKRCTLGDDPQVLTRLSHGSLVGEITEEFLDFFNSWSSQIKQLNSLLS